MVASEGLEVIMANYSGFGRQKISNARIEDLKDFKWNVEVLGGRQYYEGTTFKFDDTDYVIDFVGSDYTRVISLGTGDRYALESITAQELEQRKLRDEQQKEQLSHDSSHGGKTPYQRTPLQIEGDRFAGDLIRQELIRKGVITPAEDQPRRYRF